MLSDLMDATAAQHAGLSLRRGARVFDSVSREFGEVVIGHLELRQKKIAPVAAAAAGVSPFTVIATEHVENWTVQLEDGELVQRDRSELVAVPAGVADVEDFAL